MSMKRAAVGLVLFLVTGCGASAGRVGTDDGAPTGTPSPRDSVPPEFRSACGHPGAVVQVKRGHGIVRHDACDLTRVILKLGYGGATVPEPGRSVTGTSDCPVDVDGCGSISISTDSDTLDVTWAAS